jgi:hypothetical protein
MGPAALRLVGAATLFSAWMVLLLLGAAGRGAVHLLLAAALALFPWRAVRPSAPAPGDEEEDRR